MKNFRNLLLKEIKDMLTAQLIISLLLMMAIFYFIGGITKKEAEKAEKA
jgi:preprotein translocase subunit YajC